MTVVLVMFPTSESIATIPVVASATWPDDAVKEGSVSMRRFMSGVARRHAAHGAQQISGRDVRAIRQAIEDAPTPGLAADLLAAATRQGIHVFR